MAQELAAPASAPSEPALPASPKAALPEPASNSLLSDAPGAVSAEDTPSVPADVPAPAGTEEMAGPPPPVADGPSDEALIKEFYTEMKSVDRDNEVCRILNAFRLNPFEQLGVRFDSTPEQIRRQYRKVSLMVHPDKCSHERAKEAFEVLNAANKDLLSEERRREVIHVLKMAKEEVKKERKKATKHDAAHRLASMLHLEGRDGVEAEYEAGEAFHDAWMLKSRDMLARAEFRRRKLVQRLQDEEKRIEASEGEQREKMKRDRKHHKGWEQTREKRVGDWRDFATKKASKKAKPGAIGGIKPPKLKTWDEDKTYVQRAVGNTGFQPAGQFKPIQPQRE